MGWGGVREDSGPKEREQRVRIHFHIKQQLRDRLNEICVEYGSKTDFINSAIEQKLDREYGRKLDENNNYILEDLATKDGGGIIEEDGKL